MDTVRDTLLTAVALLQVGLYKYGDHLTPGLAEVRVYAAGVTSFLVGFFRFRAMAWPGSPP